MKDHLKVSNIKISCSLHLDKNEPFFLNKDVKCTNYSNFTLVRNQFVYTFFKSKNNHSVYHVNITKIPSKKQVCQALNNIKNLVGAKFCLKNWRKENITCSLDIKRQIPLFSLYEPLQSQKFVKKLSFNPDRFPAMFVGTKHNTVLIFSTGKMVIIGGKSVKRALLSAKLIVNFLNLYKPKHYN